VGLYYGLDYILPPSVVKVLLIIALVILTGAMHLDGLSDTCDGIAGHKTVEERWQVMHDSRVGAFGVVGVVLILLVQYVALNQVPPDKMAAMLLFMPSVSRWAMVYAIFAYPYARPTGLGKAYKEATGWPHFIVATLLILGIAGGLYPLFFVDGFLLLGGVALITTAFAFYLKYKFAGLTGDTYGAVNEVAEVVTLLFFLIIYWVAPNLVG
jgi:adenosylcobinamide-GDP ribazoletransferase